MHSLLRAKTERLRDRTRLLRWSASALLQAALAEQAAADGS
jgi:hypothetical protein